jgi:hypothetical protein
MTLSLGVGGDGQVLGPVRVLWPEEQETWGMGSVPEALSVVITASKGC